MGGGYVLQLFVAGFILIFMVVVLMVSFGES